MATLADPLQEPLEGIELKRADSAAADIHETTELVADQSLVSLDLELDDPAVEVAGVEADGVEADGQEAQEVPEENLALEDEEQMQDKEDKPNAHPQWSFNADASTINAGNKILAECEPFFQRCTAAPQSTQFTKADQVETNVADYQARAAKHERFSTAPQPFKVEGSGNAHFSNLYLAIAIAVVPMVLMFLLNLPANLYLYGFILLITALPTFAAFNVIYAYVAKPIRSQDGILPGLPISEYMVFHDPSLAAQYRGRTKIPMETFFEAYFDQKIDIKMDMLDLLERRHDWARFVFTWGQAKFFLTQWIPELLAHTKRQDEVQVTDHYDRGDDFYAAFLGPAMVYTSGISLDTPRAPASSQLLPADQPRETLESMQWNKLNLVCSKLQLQPGEKHLDIGCGWGTLVNHAAKHCGTHSTGLTLSVNQCQFARARSIQEGVEDKTDFWRMDYRDIPKDAKFDKISCLEMAEHVGVRKFQDFMLQVREMLDDDGLFFLQIAGLRRAWQHEDFIWGLFMAKYIFPGADASCPLNWVIEQLERAGFEVASMDTIGVHYSMTIGRWYTNWLKNAESIKSKYGERWFRIFEFFLAYSTIVARNGNATCYQIVAHKNLNKFDRTRFFSKRLDAKCN